MFVCPNCGANINFDPGRQLLHCDFCDTDLSPDSVIQVDDAKEDTYTETEADESSETGYREYTTTIYTCKECGGEILANDNTVATFCSYCGASTVLASRVGKERAPEHIIPFRITKEQSGELYKKAVGKALFAPKYMKEETVVDKFRGIYMPYWIYNFRENRPVSLRAQKDHRSGDYIIHTFYDVNTKVDAEYNGLAFDASSQFSDNLSEAIAPFDIKTAVPFNTSYMSGFYADAADTDSGLYEDNCKSIVISDIYSHISKHPALRSISLKAASAANLGPEHTDIEMGYFPVWFLSVRHKDRLTYAVVNGQTGEVATDIPVDHKKYIISSLILAIPLFLLLTLIPVMRPQYLLIASLAFAIASMIILCSQKNKIHIREHSLDDKGLMSRKAAKGNSGAGAPKPAEAKPVTAPAQQKASSGVGTFFLVVFVVVLLMVGGAIGGLIAAFVIVPIAMSMKNKKDSKLVTTGEKISEKAPGRDKFILCLKPLIGAVLAVCVWIFAPAADEYYYIAAVACIAGVLLSFLDIIKCHNELSTRKLPQFDKRGGDE